jgi:ABC-type transport system involved in cytochrome c biogenesis permease subunit
VAGKYRLFRIDNDQVRSLLKLERREGLRYSLEEIREHGDEFMKAVDKAQSKDEKARDLFDVHLLELSKHLQLYLAAWQGRAPLLLPPAGDGTSWRAPGDVRVEAMQAVRPELLAKVREMGLPLDQSQWTVEQKRALADYIETATSQALSRDPALAAWNDVLSAYRGNDPERFNAAVSKFKGLAEAGVAPAALRRARFEQMLNGTALFYHCKVMYLMAAVLGLAGWLALLAYPSAADRLRRAAFWWLVVTFLAHTVSLFARMYLMDRPLVFVTNLYSSAVFIGWASVGLCLILERIYPLGLGNLSAVVLGFATCQIAQFLALGGDTLEMMQAVLDTNFWLATHVTTITFGYSATYLAGLLAIGYVALSVLPKADALGKTVTVGTGAGAKPMELGKVIGQMTYGVLCLATLLSFVGTVLGGIWADQSWGRFWGWDPKENGAVLIVLWNALILHARWCGLVKDRGTAVLALVGNMITTWSWFGTNQLGVGLHAYGFNNKLAFGCMVTWVMHLVLIPIGLVPWQRVWGEPAK